MRAAQVLLVVGIVLLLAAVVMGARDVDDSGSLPASLVGLVGFAGVTVGVWLEAQRFGREMGGRR
jgi:uncharacterized membrane protein YtjA (UPF0391 family)